MQYCFRDLLRNRQIRSFLPWPDGAWLDICHSDGSTVGAGGDELHDIKENRLTDISVLPNNILSREIQKLEE